MLSPPVLPPFHDRCDHARIAQLLQAAQHAASIAASRACSRPASAIPRASSVAVQPVLESVAAALTASDGSAAARWGSSGQDDGAGGGFLDSEMSEAEAMFQSKLASMGV